jgi:SPP1 gp7 family putative phage head morphogenesis protein
VKHWLYPTGIERDYLRAINREVVAPLEAAVRATIFPILGSLRMDVDVREIPQGTGWFETLRQAFIATLVQAGISDVAIASIVRRVAPTVDAFNRREFQAVLRSVYRVDIITNAPLGLRSALDLFEVTNISLIKSIPVESLGRMHGKIVEAVRLGKTLRDTQALVRDEFGVTERRAELIARDQIGKLNGQLTQLRQEEIGVDEYTWRGVLDARERPEHVSREGQVFSWAKPPSDGHPGEPIRCRCTAEPVLPSWEEMEKRVTGIAPPAGVFT